MTRRSRVHEGRSKSRITNKDMGFFRKLQKLHKLYEDFEVERIKTIPKEIYLTSVDRITYVGLGDKDRNITEVINVSYEINFNDEWITILRFDSHHNYLHRHIRVSLTDKSEIEDSIGVKRKGSPHVWYTWAIQNIRDRFIEYRTNFAKRSKIPNLGY